MSERMVKVHLPGESVWCAVIEDSNLGGVGELRNKPVCNDLSWGDRIRWRVDEYGCRVLDGVVGREDWGKDWKPNA